MSFISWVYLLMVLSSVGLIVATVRGHRPENKIRLVDAPTRDVWEIAFLGGGPARLVDAAVAALHEDGRVAVGEPGVVTVLRDAPRDAVEAAVLNAAAATPGGALADVRRRAMADPAVQEVGDRLARRGLMRHPARGRVSRAWANLQMAGAVVLILGSVLLTAAGHLDADPVEVPTVVVIAPAVIMALVIGGICRQSGRGRLTEAGRLALRGAQATHHPSALAKTAVPAALLVAIGSAALLSDDMLREQLAQAQTAMAATAGGSSSDGGNTWVDGSAQAAWCGGSGGGSSCGGSHHGGGSSCGGHHGGSSCGGSSCGGGSSCSSGSSCGGSSCGG
ncbi:TIGR04222 domain-containing membrane protein [Streptomyces sp. NPDC059080]|uniref:TIGR04222 domain-containing membrane protein n=1 Tax=Streptomyces sp. NPDC059080 TaxID=3346718 RepID=UPI00368E9428